MKGSGHVPATFAPLMAPLLPPHVYPLPTPSLFSDSSPFPMQERLRHIGPEEFVQAFVNKDPLEGTKVKGSWKSLAMLDST